MDCELIQMIQRYCDKEITKTRPEDIAIEAIKSVGPNGHYFGVDHTQERYETAFYSPIASDWSNYEAWDLNGAVWTAQRAHKIYKNIINEFTPPQMDESIKEELIVPSEDSKIDNENHKISEDVNLCPICMSQNEKGASICQVCGYSFK